MTEHDHINRENNHSQHNRSADQRRSAAGPTEGELLKPEPLSECVICGESSTSPVLAGGVGYCRSCRAVRRDGIAKQEQHRSPVSSEVGRVIIEQIETH